MAQVAVGFFSDRLKLAAPKVATVHLDVAGGKEFSDFVEAEVKKRGEYYFPDTKQTLRRCHFDATEKDWVED